MLEIFSIRPIAAPFKALFNKERIFLNAVYVFNDKIVISCNYKDGTKTINFSDMECALTQRASIPGSDLDCPGAPRQKKLAAFRFPGSEKPGKLHSAPSFFLSKSEDSRGSSDLVLNEGSNLEAPLGPPVSCFQQGTRIIIESPGGAFIDQFKNWSIPLFAPLPREAQMHASPTTSEEARGIPL